MKSEMPTQIEKALSADKEAHIESVPLEQVFAWVEELKATESRRNWWEALGIVDASAPGAQKADEGILLTQGGQKVGAAVLAPDHLVGAFVHPGAQRQGLGRRLIETALRRLIARGGHNKILVELSDQRAEKVIHSLPEDIRAHLQIEDAYREL